jgi:hypothetical protein
MLYLVSQGYAALHIDQMNKAWPCHEMRWGDTMRSHIYSGNLTVGSQDTDALL